jgi:hypothetical protein
MAEQSPWRRLVGAIERAYERRIRAASQISEYGKAHAEQAHHEDGGEEAVIANVARGTRLGAQQRAPEPPAEE